MTPKLTTYLPTTTPTTFPRSTTHPFLQLAGSGKIPKPLLSQWLSQDRLYAQSYVRFMGLLLSKIRLPAAIPTNTNTSGSNSGSKSTTSSSEQRIMTILIDALNNIQTELQFFEDVAREYGLDLNAATAASGEDPDLSLPLPFQGGVSSTTTTAMTGFGPTPITQAYIDMFMSAGSSAVTLLEGLVVLWATEECYLRAWRYAASFLGASQQQENGDADGGALRNRFIPNWSSPEFEAFVVSIAEVVDDLAEEVFATVGSEDEKALLLGRCVRWWKQVVWLEERFWPQV